MNILLAAVILALTVLSASILYAVRAVVLYKSERDETPREPEAQLNAARTAQSQLDALQSQLDRLTLAVSDGIERVHRAESRVAKTVTSARRLVREAGLEHAGIEAEYEELQPPDAEGIQPLPPMPAEVEETRVVRFPGGQLEIGAA